MQKPTPETDSMVEESFHRINFPTSPVPAEFARKLERERDEVREKNAALGKAIRYSPEATTLLGKFLQATKERDETKLALCSLAKQFESDIQKANAMAEKAKALIDRWDRPTWKDTSPTAGFISALGNAVEAYEKTPK